MTRCGKSAFLSSRILDVIFKVNDVVDSPEKCIIVNDLSKEKQVDHSFRFHGKKDIQKSGDRRSLAIVSTVMSKSIDVVVDIHREHREDRMQQRNEDVTVLLKDKNTTRRFLQNSDEHINENVFHRRHKEKSKDTHKSSRLQKLHDDVRVIDSLDLIEEYQESSVDEKHDKTTIKSIPDKQPRNRRQWDPPEHVGQIEDLKRPPRKRWSKDTSVIRLPETKNNSSAASSIENVSPLIRKRPVPLARMSLQQESPFSFDNAAFVLENEEILRIETDPNKGNPKIEIRKISDQFEDSEISASSDQTRRSVLSSRSTARDTVIMVEDLHKSRSDTNDRCFINQETTVLDIENSESFDKNQRVSSNISHTSTSKKKIIDQNDKITNNSSLSDSLEEISKRTDLSSEESIKSDLSTRDKELKKSHQSLRRKNLKYSSQDTLSTNEENELDDDYVEEARLEGKSTKMSTKRRNAASEGKENRLQNKGKKKKNRNDDIISSTQTQDSIAGEEISKKKKKKKKREEEKKDIKYISVTIHRADIMETDYITKHPMVKVHIVEAESGKYLKNTNEENGCKYLQPIITGKFDFRENRSMIPVWEEELIFEYDFDALLKSDKEQIVILFEIIDLLTFAEASFNYDKFGSEGCWYKIAWAFLKPVGRNNTIHTDKKVRLQLYRPRRGLRKYERHTCEVYTWWKSNSREKYPSSLFVTVTSVDPPKLEPVFYQQLSLYDLSDVRSESQNASARTTDSISLLKWTRLAAQSCKVPNKLVFETEVSENGHFFVAFSNDGKYLACISSEEYDYPIVVYEVEAKKICVRFMGHKTFVYSLHWSDDDNYLLSVSSDQTARVWDVQNQIIQHIEMMPHPSYVYCGKFYPMNSSVAATGCYDRVTRIWVKNKKSRNRDLSQELEGHEGFVNSMCFQKNGNLLTADSIGAIIIWTMKKNRKMLSKKEWHISRKIKVRDIEGITINTIILHPLESRLLVHSRNNGLRMLDLTTGVVLQKYAELNNQRIQSTACISPCGGLILCGGEDTSLNIWNLETGKHLARYTIERNFRAVTCVDYHPYDHVLAYSTFGSPASVRILRFDKDSTGEDIGLQLMGEPDTGIHTGDASTSFLNTSLIPRERSRSTSRKRTPRELSKESFHIDRTRKSLSRESIRNFVEEPNDKYDNAKLKLQRLNETEQTLKSRSASRLYNIIEKIDKILLNSARSPDDLESGRHSTSLRERSYGNFAIDAKGESGRTQNKSGKSKSSMYSTIEDHSASYFDSSTTSTSKNEIIELKTSKNIQENSLNDKKKRSKSAKELRAKQISEDELSKTLSDSAMNSRKVQVYNDIMRTMYNEDMESSFIVQPMEENNRSPASMVLRKNNYFTSDHSSSPGSTGTYVVEKAAVEKNDDRMVHGSTKNNSNIMKISEGESSVRSGATFTIENEIPIPKPRRRKNLI